MPVLNASSSQQGASAGAGATSSQGAQGGPSSASSRGKI